MTSAWKRVFSIALVLCLLLAAVPVYALALEPEDFTDSRDILVKQLKDDLGAHKSHIALYYKTFYKLTEDDVKSLFADALIKDSSVGNSSGYLGDYLLFSVADVSINVEYTVQDIYIYNKISYDVTYFSTDEQEARMREKAEEMNAAMLNQTKNDYQRFKWIYDYVREHVSLENNDHGSAYSAVMEGKTNSYGAAALVYCLALNSGMDARIVTGSAGDRVHGWNLVRVYDRWYVLDLSCGRFMEGSDHFGDHAPDAYYLEEAFTARYPVAAADFDAATVAKGTLDNGLSWNYDAAKAALTISGNGPMQDFLLQSYANGLQIVSRPWDRYVGEGAAYIVGEGVTSVGENAFYNVLFDSIELASTVQTIGAGAFRSSRGTAIALPEGITVIPEQAFKDSWIMEVRIPASVERIEQGAFSGCARLAELHLPAGLKALGDGVCDGCRSLRKVLFDGDEAAWKAVKLGANNQNIREVLKNGSGGFFDVPEGEWFYAPVTWAAERNITGGIGNGKFGSYEGCTRAQVVTFLWAASGRPEPVSTDNPFTDVAEDAWYLKPVLWAVENGITQGVSETEFAPDRTCTRAQIVTFLYAAAGKPEVGTDNPFTDVSESDWFLAPVLWAAEKDVTGGIAEGLFGPNDVCTRAQVVTFLYKVFAGK